MSAIGISGSKMLARDWRGGELGVLIAALILAVGVVSGISAFASRLQSALEQESHRFLAADRVVKSGQMLGSEPSIQAQELGLAQARTLQFPTMLSADNGEMSLVSVKAVSERYPLRGELTYSTEPFGPAIAADSGPAVGEVWLDSRLYALLDVQLGDRVQIGDSYFAIVAAARTEPDQGASFSGYGPRVLMNIEDIPATDVVQPGSRVEYRYLYAGDEAVLSTFVSWLEPRLQPGQRLLDVNDGQPGIGSALGRAERFLLLAGSLGVVLAAIAIALAARRFSQRHYDYVAIMKSLGATSGQISRLYRSNLFLLGLFATVLGCALGWVLQESFFRAFAEQLPVMPGPSGPRPYAIGAATAFTCLLCFAWPPLRRLGQASPLRVLRRDVPLENTRSVFDYLIGLIAICLLMWWYSGDWKLTGAVLAGLSVTLVCGLGLTLALLRGGRLLGMSAGSIWRLALAGLQRRGSGNALQVVMFAMAIMLVMVLLLVRTSLLDEWKNQLPADAPDHFMINISPEEVQDIDQMLRSEHIRSEALYPMIRGRVMAVNGVDLPPRETADDGPHQRESNFTWSDTIPDGNKLLQGQWWEAGTSEALVSVEQEFAERMQFEIGDKVSFLVGSEPLVATVASIRELDWQSMKPNFFLVFPPDVLANFPATFMTSFHLEKANKPFLNRFIRAFPTVTIIEMDMVIEQIRSIVDQVSAAIELVLGVILAAGALVLIAGVQASVDDRMRESAILRALGAGKRLILGGLAIEFATMGFFAGLLATFGAELSVYILQTQVMDLTYSMSPQLWPVGLISGVLIIGGLGVFSCRKVVYSSPIVLLRDI